MGVEAETSAPLILTLQLDAAAQMFYEAFRQRFYPPEKNLIPAHLTLFHQLPDVERTMRHLSEIARDTHVFPIASPRAASIGRGVVVFFQSNRLMDLHAKLTSVFEASLIPQDRQRFRPHIVVQNKVSSVQVGDTLRQLQDTPLTEPTALGLSVWRYLGGPWEHRCDLPFHASRSVQTP
jgi:2'-5' RNA ligase